MGWRTPEPTSAPPGLVLGGVFRLWYGAQWRYALGGIARPTERRSIKMPASLWAGIPETDFAPPGLPPEAGLFLPPTYVNRLSLLGAMYGVG
jgi:hypothetical protein